MSIPVLSRIAINVAKVMDTLGILPKALLDGIPFHTTLFLTNLASINTGPVFHHTYDFGTTGVFVSIGKLKRASSPLAPKKLLIPLGAVVDERICPGVTFARGYEYLKRYLTDPSLLETPPEQVNQDIK